MTQSSFIQGLTEILHDAYGETQLSIGNWQIKYGTLSVQEAICALIKTELVPEEEELLSNPPLHDYEDGGIEGWNSCRQEMLRRLER